MKTIFNLHMTEVLQPKDIITFNQEYQDDLHGLREYLKTHTRRVIRFATQRMTEHGVSVREYQGELFSSTTNGFWVKREKEGKPQFVRFDNVLGEVPCLMENSSKNYFTISPQFNELKMQYDVLHKKQGELVGRGVQLYYTYVSGSVFAGDGNYSVKGNVIAVNQSNIEYQHMLTWGGKQKPFYVDMVPRFEVDRFIAPDRILTKIVLLDTPVVINPHDEE